MCALSFAVPLYSRLKRSTPSDHTPNQSNKCQSYPYHDPTSHLESIKRAPPTDEKTHTQTLLLPACRWSSETVDQHDYARDCSGQSSPVCPSSSRVLLTPRRHVMASDLNASAPTMTQGRGLSNSTNTLRGQRD